MATVELTQANFESTIMNNAMVIVDFWAPWCGPCQNFAPIYEKVSAEHEDVVFAKLNTEEEQQIAMQFGIRSIPTLMLFREQIQIFNQAGMLPEPALQELLGQAKALDMEKVRADIEAQKNQA